jgi:hypothetical protein
VKWIKVDRTRRIPPKTGKYGDWKEQIATECNCQCVYCALHERQFGGRRYGHIDHFRPKGNKKFKEFKKLRNEIQNLYFACAVCNCFKSDDWPAEPTNDHSVDTFIDPSDHDYNQIFSVAAGTYEVTSTFRAGLFVIEKLFLNRPHLITERRLYDTLKGMDERLAELEKSIMPLFRLGAEAESLMTELVASLTSLRESAKILKESIVYHVDDQKRK